VSDSFNSSVFACNHHAENSEDTMMIVLDEWVNSKADMNNLGIFNGNYILVAPECEITENGYIKSSIFGK